MPIKRDKNGRFASSGGSSSLATSRTRQAAVKSKSAIMAGGSQKALRSALAKSSMEKTARTLRRSEMQRANLKDSSYAGKVSTTRTGNTVSPTKSRYKSRKGK